jgi:DNA-binding transcriptional MerR regulator
MGEPAELSFGTGIYSFPAAARLLAKRQPGLQPGTLRYWMKTGLTPASYGKAPSGSHLLSFHDLVSLELVRRFRVKGVSLQRVRKLESELKRRYPKIVRPMAYDVFYTDGSGIWHQFNPRDDTVVEEIVGRRPGHYAWAPAIQSFAEEIRY